MYAKVFAYKSVWIMCGHADYFGVSVLINWLWKWQKICCIPLTTDSVVVFQSSTVYRVRTISSYLLDLSLWVSKSLWKCALYHRFVKALSRTLSALTYSTHQAKISVMHNLWDPQSVHFSVAYSPSSIHSLSTTSTYIHINLQEDSLSYSCIS